VICLFFCTETAVVGRLAVLLVVLREGTDAVDLVDEAVTRGTVLDVVLTILDVEAAVFRDVVVVLLDVVVAVLLDDVAAEPEAKGLVRKVPEDEAGPATALSAAVGPARERGAAEVRVEDGAIERACGPKVGFTRDGAVVERCPTVGALASSRALGKEASPNGSSSSLHRYY
jgi:hypothetical protein